MYKIPLQFLCKKSGKRLNLSPFYRPLIFRAKNWTKGLSYLVKYFFFLLTTIFSFVIIFSQIVKAIQFIFGTLILRSVRVLKISCPVSLLKKNISITENESYSRRQRLSRLHDGIWHGRHAGPIHVSRRSRLLPASGDAHES